ncbi:MAG TPA: hypothetical protein VGI95_14455 [Caulobacteraceae bacterium]|jgi:hypothetical protein
MNRTLIGLCACATIAIPSISTSAPKAASAPAAPAFHWKWVLTVNADAVYIGEAEDDESNSVSCNKPLNGKVEFHLHVDADPPKGPAPWKTRMTVRSGAASVTVPAKAEDNEDAGGADVNIDLPVKSPVVVAFGQTGALKMNALGYNSDSPPVPVAKAAKLVKLCGG